MDVVISKSVFSRRRNFAPPRRAPRAEEAISNTDLDAYHLAQVKNQPGDHVFPEFTRPIHPICRECVVNSQAMIHRNYLALGSHSCFMLETMNNYNPFYVRLMPQLFHYIRLPSPLDGKKAVTPAEVMAAAKSMGEAGWFKLPSTEEVFELDLEKTMAFASLFGSSRVSMWASNFFTRFAGWILGKILSYSFQSVCVHYGELEMVRIAMETGLPIIFVPVYRSHLDSLVISWLLLNRGYRPPEFIAPHSLLETPILGRFAKFFGGLGFHQERIHSELGYMNRDVNAALLVYMNVVWEKGNSVILPVETHRSRSGRPSTRLFGREFFSALLKLYESRRIEDAYLIPVSVNYDILPEEDLITGYQVKKLLKPKFRQWLTRLWKNLGFARVSFSQPFRLREFKFSQPRLAPPNIPKNWQNLPITDSASVVLPALEMNWVDDNGSVSSLSSIYGETEFLEPEDANLVNADALLTHSFFDASRTSVFMSTQLVAFLLLKKYSTGVSFEELVIDTLDLSLDIRKTHKQDIGYTGKTEVVVERAIALLGSDCIQKYKGEGSCYMLKPVSKKSSLVKLNYYASQVMSLYALQGIVAVALFSLLSHSVTAYRDIALRAPFIVLESDVMNKALQIAELMKAEFLLHAPCKRMTTAIGETLERMKDYYGELQFDSSKKLYHGEVDLMEDSDSDEPMPREIVRPMLPITVNNSSEILNQLKFKQGLITPYLQFYSVATQSLKLLIPPQGPTDPIGFQGVEDIFLRKAIYDSAEMRRNQGFLRTKELITMDTIRNFLNMMETIGVIRYYAHSETKWEKLYYLTSAYENTTALDALSATILSFCT